jgi:hypothetical protein
VAVGVDVCDRSLRVALERGVSLPELDPPQPASVATRTSVAMAFVVIFIAALTATPIAAATSATISSIIDFQQRSGVSVPQGSRA